jgi:hypothetical protein
MKIAAACWRLPIAICLVPPRELKREEAGRHLYERVGSHRKKAQSCVVSRLYSGCATYMGDQIRIKLNFEFRIFQIKSGKVEIGQAKG